MTQAVLSKHPVTSGRVKVTPLDVKQRIDMYRMWDNHIRGIVSPLTVELGAPTAKPRPHRKPKTNRKTDRRRHLTREEHRMLKSGREPSLDWSTIRLSRRQKHLLTEARLKASRTKTSRRFPRSPRFHVSVGEPILGI